MHVVGCQLDIAWKDKGTSHARVRRLLAAAPPPPGSLVVLPEMFSTGFSMDVDAVAEGEARASERFLAELARELGVTVLGGVVNRAADGRGLNQAVTFAPSGEEVARYSKLHPFSFAGEDRHYARGREVVLLDVSGVCVAPFVCYDLRFPEVFRVATRRGAHLLAIIANWPTARHAHWRALLVARAIENQAYVVGINRCGRDPSLEYRGGSIVLDPCGEPLAEAGEGPGVVSAECPLAPLEAYRRLFPAVADIHPDFGPQR